MTPEQQLKEDRNLVKRIDEYGKNLSDSEIAGPLTDKQRKLAEAIEKRRVE